MSALPRAGAEIVPARRTPPPGQPAARRRRPRRAAAPTIVALACLVGGIAARGRVPLIALVAGGVVAVLVVDHTARRRHLPPAGRNRALAAALAAAATLLVAATGALNLVTLGAVVMVTAIATVRLSRPSPAELRREQLDARAAGWQAVAVAIGEPHVQLNGPVVDRGAAGHTYPVRVPKGMTIDHLARRVDELTSALGRRRGEVTVEIDAEWHTLAYIHVREGETQAAAEVLDPPITSCCDPLPVLRMVDGALCYLRLFVRDIGARNMLVAGTQGSGKTSLVIRALRLLVKAPDLAIWIADGAKGRDFGVWKGCCDQYTEDPKAFYGLVLLLEKEIERRQRVMAERGWRVWKPSRTDPALWLIIEESKTFADSPYGAEIAFVLGKIGGTTRAVMVEITVITQYPTGRNVLGMIIRKESVNRVCAHTEEPDAFVLQGGQNTAAIPADAHGTVYAELYGDDRDPRLPRRVIWTSDEDRAATIKEWAGMQAFKVGAEVAYDINREQAQSGEQPPAALDADGVVDGEVLTVRPLRFEPVREAPAPRPEMTFQTARVTFQDMLKNAGKAGVTVKDLIEATGRQRTWIRENLIIPATDSGWVAINKDRREHAYYLADADAARTPAP